MLDHLPEGEYFWSVQAVDAAFNGSPFAWEATFTVAQPRITLISVPEPGQVQMECRGVTSTSYTIQSSTNMTQWTDIANLAATTNGLMKYVDDMATNGPARFYRLRSQ